MRQTLLLLLTPYLLAAAPAFQIHLKPEAAKAPLDGRLIVVVSKDTEGEPRLQVTWGVETQQIFGMDVDGWKPGDTVQMRGDTPGAPMRTLADLPPGKYTVQAVLNLYETFHRADGHILKLHPDHGEGQQWNRSPGNLYSKPRLVDLQQSSHPPRLDGSDSSARSAQRHQVRPPLSHAKQAADRVLGPAGVFGRLDSRATGL